jgi:nitrite reductase (cytochrome c-552)
MPYMREGAMKVSDHHIRSPLLNIARACQPCHNMPETELAARVKNIQDKSHALMERSATALTDMMSAIVAARTAGATEEQLKPALQMHRKAQWRLDFVNAENSMGFHAPQEAARILGESIDYSRQGQAIALSLRAPAAPPVTAPAEPVHGVTPATAPSP